MPNLLQLAKNYLDGVKPKPEVKVEIIKPEGQEVALKPFEEKLNFLYMGCYNVNPVNPVITQELGLVQNQRDCINLGKSKGYKYVALQEGNLCLGANNIDLKTLDAEPRTSCNMVCDESSAGYCGGVLKNQIYSTVIPTEFQQKSTNNPTTTETMPKNEKVNDSTPNPLKESFRHLENFASYKKDMNLINNNISETDMLCSEPINKYTLVLSVLIAAIMGYVMVDIIYKKNNK